MQRSAAEHRLHHRSASRSGCSCDTKAKVASTADSKALTVAGTSTAVATDSASEGDAKGTGVFLNTCIYNQPDLVFWRLVNTAYLRGGIVLDHTIAYTDSCKMCEYNNVQCNKQEVELTDGNCFCVWRENGAEMQTMLLSCSACVTDCIGVYKTFDLGKPEPAMQKGICLRKKPHKALDDIPPIGTMPS